MNTQNIQQDYNRNHYNTGILKMPFNIHIKVLLGSLQCQQNTVELHKYSLKIDLQINLDVTGLEGKRIL